MTALATIIRAQIARFGPMPVSDYMALCLLHPKHGYYTTHAPLGREGDFITAPEISQMFGELLGLMLVQGWIDQGRPTPFLLVEPGPGRGTLMADMLRAARMVPAFLDAADIRLIEASTALRAVQKTRLAAYPVRWSEALSELPDLPLFLVANEFLDALPVRQYLRAGAGWRERMVGIDAGDQLCFGLAGEAPVAALQGRLAHTPEGQTVEVCPAAEGFVSEGARHIANSGGLAVLVDYGSAGVPGDSFQAVRRHHKVDPLATPGAADLSAHVDFRAMRQAALDAGGDRPLTVSPLVTQGELLERLGITARAEALAANLAGEARENHIAAHRRLTHPAEMGNLFKALAIYPEGVVTPPGFTDHDA